jgi:hypothetical protein
MASGDSVGQKPIIPQRVRIINPVSFIVTSLKMVLTGSYKFKSIVKEHYPFSDSAEKYFSI